MSSLPKNQVAARHHPIAIGNEPRSAADREQSQEQARRRRASGTRLQAAVVAHDEEPYSDPPCTD